MRPARPVAAVVGTLVAAALTAAALPAAATSSGPEAPGTAASDPATTAGATSGDPSADGASGTAAPDAGASDGTSGDRVERPRPEAGSTPATSARSRMAATSAADPEDLARALDIPAEMLVSASIGESDPRGFAVTDGVQLETDPNAPDPNDPVPMIAPQAQTQAQSDDGVPFPTRGDDFLVMSTGDASQAMLPTSSELSTVLDGLDNEQGNDKVQLELVLAAPWDARCLAFDVAFLSEEYPNYVGTQYNDAFTAQLGIDDMWIEDGAVVAPMNFAHDSQGNPLTVNAAFELAAATGSAYDGATPRLRAAAPMFGGGEVTVHLTIQDLGDSVLDSAVFLDNLFFSTDETCRFGSTQDSDGDGLLDEWETNGLTMVVGDEQYFVDLPAMGAHPRTKDVFVEIDHMVAGPGETRSHRPDPQAIAEVVDAFASYGIHLHVDYGASAPLTWGDAAVWGSLSRANTLPHQEFLGTNGFFTGSYSWRAFDLIKEQHLDPARAAVFHYNVWAHHMADDPDSQHDMTSGRSRGVEGGASDFIVSLGDYGPSWRTEAGTFMHELGHNLGLGHGGGDHVNYKPNYLSVMNYAFQFRGMVGSDYPGPTFDYSFAEYRPLDERDLDESVGVGITGDLGLRTKYDCVVDDEWDATTTSTQPIDWNCDGDTDDSGVSRSVNGNTRLEVLHGHNDWRNLVFTGGAIGMPGGIVELPVETVDPEPEADRETFERTVDGAPVVDAAPVLDATTVRTGVAVTASLPFTVPAGDGADVTAEWSWGDGTTSAGEVAAGASPQVTGSHAWTAPGTYDVTVALTGPDGWAVSAPVTVVVEDEPAVTGRGSVSALGWFRTTAAPGSRSTTVQLVLDARHVGDHGAPLGGSLLVDASRGRVFVGLRPDSLVVDGGTAVVEGPALMNTRSGYRQRITVVEGRPTAVRVQVWDPRLGGPETARAVVLDTTAGAPPTAAPTVVAIIGD